MQFTKVLGKDSNVKDMGSKLGLTALSMKATGLMIKQMAMENCCMQMVISMWAIG